MGPRADRRRHRVGGTCAARGPSPSWRRRRRTVHDQAAISAVHADAATPADTDWGEIVGLYDALQQIAPSPIVELNRAVAVAMRDGPIAGLALIDDLLDRGELKEYRLAHAARAELCRRLGRTKEARTSLKRALELTKLEPERRLLERRLAQL